MKTKFLKYKATGYKQSLNLTKFKGKPLCSADVPWGSFEKPSTTFAKKVVLVSLLLTLNRFHTLFWFFYCLLWTSKCRLGFFFRAPVNDTLSKLHTYLFQRGERYMSTISMAHLYNYRSSLSQISQILQENFAAVTLFKSDSSTCVFLWTWQNF